MPRDSSGNYTLPSGINPVADGEIIEGSWANTTLDDVAAALTGSLSRSGQGGMLTPLLFEDGVEGLPGAAFAQEPSSGLWRGGAGDVRISAGGVQAIRFQDALTTIPTALNVPLVTAPTTLTLSSDDVVLDATVGTVRVNYATNVEKALEVTATAASLHDPAEAIAVSVDATTTYMVSAGTSEVRFSGTSQAAIEVDSNLHLYRSTGLEAILVGGTATTLYQPAPNATEIGMRFANTRIDIYHVGASPNAAISIRDTGQVVFASADGAANFTINTLGNFTFNDLPESENGSGLAANTVYKTAAGELRIA
jgi:hypothetical protein